MTESESIRHDNAVPQQRFFYVHIQKTAGTALKERLKRQFPGERMYPNASDGDYLHVAPQLSVSQLLRRWDERRDEIELVTGHFPLATVELLDADFVTLTVLREPVERMLSHLHRHRELTPSVRDEPLEDIYAGARETISTPNHMVRMFAMTADEVAASKPPRTWPLLTPLNIGPAHLVRAKEQLSRVDVIGFQDHLEEFCGELQTRFGWRLGEPLYANRTARPTVVSEEFRARIAADNALDAELYEFARDLCARRSSDGVVDA